MGDAQHILLPNEHISLSSPKCVTMDVQTFNVQRPNVQPVGSSDFLEVIESNSTLLKKLMLPKSYQQTQVKKFASTDQTPLSCTNKHHYKISIQKQLPLITITRLFILFTVRMCKYNNSLINKVLILLQYWPKAKRITASIIIINKLCYQHPRTSLFYLLLKIHKANYPGRPIASAISCSTSQIATYLDYLLTSLVKPQPTYINDS